MLGFIIFYFFNIFAGDSPILSEKEIKTEKIDEDQGNLLKGIVIWLAAARSVVQRIASPKAL